MKKTATITEKENDMEARTPTITFGRVTRSPEGRSFDVFIDGVLVGSANTISEADGGQDEWLADLDDPDAPAWTAGDFGEPFELDCCTPDTRDAKADIKRELLERAARGTPG